MSPTSSDAVWIQATVPTRVYQATTTTKTNDLNGQQNVFKRVKTKIETENDVANLDCDSEKPKKCLEDSLAEWLSRLNITDAVWMPSQGDDHYQVYFNCSQSSAEQVLAVLQAVGIGTTPDTSLGCVPFGLFYAPSDDSNDSERNIRKPKSVETEKVVEKSRSAFLRSLTARLTVAQVAEGVRSGAETSFDYYAYLLLAAWMASMGLVNNTQLDIGASMLIEPLMGSVVAMSFGLILRSRSLFWLGARGIGVGVVVSALFGYLFGLIFFTWRFQWTDQVDYVWPTEEMHSRGMAHSLLYGSFIAVIGGAVLSIVLLRNNQVALIGVALATTFMPPAVNSGLCLALATHLQIESQGQAYRNYSVGNATYWLQQAYVPPLGYTTIYSVDMRLELMALAGVSLAYTAINVVLLAVSSLLILWAKQVPPLRRLLPPEHRRFLEHDIPVYREWTQAHPENENKSRDSVDEVTDESAIGDAIVAEWEQVATNSTVGVDAELDAEARQALRDHTLQHILDDVESDPNYQTITSHAFGARYQPSLSRRLSLRRSTARRRRRSTGGGSRSARGSLATDDLGGIVNLGFAVNAQHN